ncbi:MAG: thiamine diphosphokinase [Ruminococcaceae bacterium]|nr:thiamine diphosphokinase [Oscillospiraceae bacterium]
MSTCYIVGAGEFYGDFTPYPDDLVIAADGGYRELCKRGIRCDLLIGDMDSIEDLPDDVETIKFPVEKDETDTHLAYLEGQRRGCSHFEIYGGTGGRADHTFANYCLLSHIRADGATAVLHGKDSIAYIIRNESTRVLGMPGKHISVFAFGGEARGVFIKGLCYELSDGVLTPNFPLGVSNGFAASEGEISVSNGTLLIIAEI